MAILDTIPRPQSFKATIDKVLDRVLTKRRAATQREPLLNVVWAYLVTVAFCLVAVATVAQIFIWASANGSQQFTVILALLILLLARIGGFSANTARTGRRLSAGLALFTGRIRLKLRDKELEETASDLTNFEKAVGNREFHLVRLGGIGWCHWFAIEMICLYYLFSVIGNPFSWLNSSTLCQLVVTLGGICR